MNGLTDYQAKYLAHELTLRARSDSVEKLATALADAQVDLNPHQVEAALFAFNSPLSKGAILADEVGLGKTIEAGLLLAQKWAERKRRLLIIVPANLRKQWSQELADKFHLPSAILESRTFNAAVKGGNLNPFQQDAIILCSYQFARTKDAYVQQTPWDLVVVDEAHRLRNVYKPTNKIANAIKAAIDHAPKVLLTATPLQNSLLELYGLVSVVDEHTFGDLDSFRARYTRGAGGVDFVGLKDRWMRCEWVAVNSIEPEDYVVCTAVLDSGRTLDVSECRRLLELPATVNPAVEVDGTASACLDTARVLVEQPILEAVAARNSGWFDVEMDKLDRWAEDRRESLKAALDELDVKLRDLRKAARSAPNLPEKFEWQRDAKRMESKRDEAWRDYDHASREVEKRKDELLDEITRTMLASVEINELFTVTFAIA